MVFHDILLRLGLDPKDFSVRGSILCDAWTGSFSKARGFDVRRCLVGYLIGELTAVKFFPRNFQSSQMYILWINTVWAFKMNPFWSNRSLERRELCAMFVWRWFHFPHLVTNCFCAKAAVVRGSQLHRPPAKLVKSWAASGSNSLFVSTGHETCWHS